MIRSTQQTMKRKKSSQHNKAHIWKAHSSYCSQWLKTEHWIFGPVSSFCSQEKLRAGDVLLLGSAIIRGSITLGVYHKFSYQLLCTLFSVYSGTWVSQLVPLCQNKEIWSMYYCWIYMSLGGNFWSFPCHHCVDVTSFCLLVKILVHLHSTGLFRFSSTIFHLFSIGLNYSTFHSFFFLALFFIQSFLQHYFILSSKLFSLSIRT